VKFERSRGLSDASLNHESDDDDEELRSDFSSFPLRFTGDEIGSGGGAGDGHCVSLPW
jgi:hypothetical protein